MFIAFTIGLMLLKYLALGVVCLFVAEDLELTQEVGGNIYNMYAAAGIGGCLALIFFVLGRKLLWLIVALFCGFTYFSMYNTSKPIAEIHQQNNIADRYFKDSATFMARMKDVSDFLQKKLN